MVTRTRSVVLEGGHNDDCQRIDRNPRGSDGGNVK